MRPRLVKRNKPVQIFMDLEFTGLHQCTSLVSLALVTINGISFYAEFTNYDQSQIDNWLQEHVIDNLYLFPKQTEGYEINNHNTTVKGTKEYVLSYLQKWLKQFSKIEIWSDCLAYDWVLFCELFGGARNLPKNIYYIPFDICTAFKIAGIDPDISREEFAETSTNKEKHNCLWDAKIIRNCYLKLSRNRMYWHQLPS